MTIKKATCSDGIGGLLRLAVQELAVGDCFLLDGSPEYLKKARQSIIGNWDGKPMIQTKMTAEGLYIGRPSRILSPEEYDASK